jgi:plastocyanin
VRRILRSPNPQERPNRKKQFVKLTRVALVAGALLLMLASAACMGGSSGGSYGSSSASTPVPTKAGVSTSSSPAGNGAQKQLAITAQDFSFSAGAINVAKGDTIAITFKNSGPSAHTLAFYSDAGYKNPIAGADTGSVSSGATKTFTVTADVGLFYRCNIHPTQMQGKIDFK